MKDISNKYLREEYISRINRVIDYIEKNLDKDLSLSNLSGIAHFSKFHFHRIFAAMVGETINHFILRLRIEKAAALLIRNHRQTITEIAFECGFSGSAPFSRAFKNMYDISPSQWRSGGFDQHNKNSKTNSKISQTIGKAGQDFHISSFYIDNETFNQIWRIKMKNKKEMQIEVKEMPGLHVAYVRNVGPYKGDGLLFEGLFNKLMTWAGPRGFLASPDVQVLSVYHDDPDITAEDKLRISVCVTVPQDTKVEGEIGKMTIAGGKYAVARFELAGSEEYEQAWNMVMGGWLPDSGYQPDDNPCYENYRNNPKEHPEGIHIVDICVPVKPL